MISAVDVSPPLPTVVRAVVEHMMALTPGRPPFACPSDHESVWGIEWLPPDAEEVVLAIVDLSDEVHPVWSISWGPDEVREEREGLTTQELLDLATVLVRSRVEP